MTTQFLRQVLAADAVTGAAAGLVMVAGADMLAPLLQLNRDILFYAGIAMAPFVVMLTWLAMQPQPPRTGVMTIVVLNALWVIGSIALIVTGIEQPNLLGYGFVIAQAVAVGVFAELEYIALKRLARTA